MRELVVEHLPDCTDGPPVRRVGIPGDQRIDERRVEERRIVLPVDPAQRLPVEDGVVEEDLRPRLRIARHPALDEVPAEPQHVVVAESGAGFVPGQEPALAVQNGPVPRQQSVHRTSPTGPQRLGTARVHQPEFPQRRNEHEVGAHVCRVRPRADERLQRRRGVEAAHGSDEWDRLVACLDHTICSAPPELQRHSRVGDRTGVAQWAPARICSGTALRRAADLLARQSSQARPDRVTPSAEAPSVAGETGKVPIAPGHARHGIEGSGAR